MGRGGEEKEKKGMEGKGNDGQGGKERGRDLPDQCQTVA